MKVQLCPSCSLDCEKIFITDIRNLTIMKGWEGNDLSLKIALQIPRRENLRTLVS